MLFKTKHAGKYRATIRPGQKAIKSLGLPYVKGISLFFENQEAYVPDEDIETIELIRESEHYGTYIFEDDGTVISNGVDHEPRHNSITLKGGDVKSTSSPAAINKELAALVAAQTKAMLDAMLPGILEAAKASWVAEAAATTTEPIAPTTTKKKTK